MAFQLSAKERKSLDQCAKDLDAAREGVEAAMLDYAAALVKTRTLRTEVFERLNLEFELKSEQFRDSIKGDEVANMLAEWEDLDLDEPALDLEHGEKLNQLPTALELQGKA